MAKIRTLSAGVIPVHLFNREWRFLLLRAYRNWDFPKGAVEPGESPLEAARREVAEETGITDLRFRWGYGYCETAVYGRGKVARYYLAETASSEFWLPVNPQLGRPEHHEGRWLSAQAARQRLPQRLQPLLRWALASLFPS